MKRAILTVATLLAALGPWVPAHAGSASGTWDFDGPTPDPGLIRRQDGTSPNFQHSFVAGAGDLGRLSIQMTREAATERLFMNLPASYGEGDVFRLRTRYRTTSTESAQVAVGFFSSTGPNSTGLTEDSVEIDWSGGLTGTGDVPGDRERSGFSHVPGRWYISELTADFVNGTWTMDLFQGNTGALLEPVPGAPRTLGAFDNPPAPLDILSFANEDCCDADRFFSMDFDWVTYAINADLPADPRNIPEPATAALGSLGGLVVLALRRRRRGV